MNATARVLAATLVMSALSGCANNRDSLRTLGELYGPIRPRDIDNATLYRAGLAHHLGLPERQVRVEPGSGVTFVVISGIAAEDDRQRIATELATLNSKNPKLNPLRWTFD